MKVFFCKKDTRFCFVAVAFNKGHAVKLFSKELKLRGEQLHATDTVSEIITEESQAKKGLVYCLLDTSNG